MTNESVTNSNVIFQINEIGKGIFMVKINDNVFDYEKYLSLYAIIYDLSLLV